SATPPRGDDSGKRICKLNGLLSPLGTPILKIDRERTAKYNKGKDLEIDTSINTSPSLLSKFLRKARVGLFNNQQVCKTSIGLHPGTSTDTLSLRCVSITNVTSIPARTIS